ncbi:chromate efflux transporter [Corynebacterium tuberculostearicum]|uniref:chromate efflux transporter n=1 Tax=Corynebacterium tuberculostearicum TaxID=38304 RepID=UPI002653D8EC|nr:chromate efflux transporter [Corynebacterium tuberculostearicum]MDN8595874.1 chromate efflux transporter [Corynebacterium tuberculostearicum]MDV2431254.1 chromate efflux transporter [Corynebacterium tuberculostearicum]
MTSSHRLLREVRRSFLPLGWTAFGGPAAHIGYFRTEFVERRRWVSDATYGDLVAMSQFLPGPASSKVGMALGYSRAGIAGMASSWFLFTFPSAFILCLFGLLVSPSDKPGWLSGLLAGLLAAAAGVVAHAIYGMTKKLLRTPMAWALAIASSLILILTGSAWQLPVLAMAGLLGALFSSRTGAALPTPKYEDTPDLKTVPAHLAWGCLSAFFLLLIGLAGLAQLSDGYLITRANAFYQSGALVFGGGHVVLPLLEDKFVGAGWLSQADFLAGYSVAQGVPGPLFTFASYLGAVDGGIGGAIFGTVLIFLPGALLTLAALHFWSRWNHLRWLRGAFAALSAAVIGLLVSALWDPIITHGITGWTSGAIALGAAIALWRKLPPWAVAISAALAGVVFL